MMYKTGGKGMKIKNISIILLAVMVMAMVSACKPSGMAQETYDTGLKALEVMEQYNKGELTDDVAQDRIDSLIEHLEGIETSDIKSDHENEMVKLIMQSFSISVSAGGDTFANEQDLKKALGE